MDRFQKVYSQGTIEMGMLRVLLRCLIKMENRLWHCNLCRFYLQQKAVIIAKMTAFYCFYFL